MTTLNKIAMNKKKLSLDKEVISVLNHEEKSKIYAGQDTADVVGTECLPRTQAFCWSIKDDCPVTTSCQIKGHSCFICF